MIRHFLQAMVLLALLIGTTIDGAEAGVYEVAGIRVAAEAASTSAARNRALRQGQEQALDIVLRRLAVRADWSRLPQATDLDIDALVEGFRVGNEKTAPRRYSAALFVQFAPDLVRAILQKEAIAISETQSRPALLMTVLEDERGLQAWGGHWWQRAWLARDLANNPAPLIAPLGDAQDTSIATADDIIRGAPVPLRVLNARYGTSTIMVAHALAATAGQLGVTLYIFGEDESDVVVRTYLTPPTQEGQEEVARQAVDSLLNLLAERWKATASIADNRESIVHIRARFADLPSWLKMLKSLGAAHLVRDASIVEVSTQSALLRVAFVGSMAQLGEQLDRQGLRLFNEQDLWLLAHQPKK